MGKKSLRKDIERLSAYLDGELKPQDAKRLKSRLQQEPRLLIEYQKLAVTRSVLRAAPPIKAPRNFTVTATMVGNKPPSPAVRWLLPMRLASAFSTALLLMVMVSNLMIGSGVPAGAAFKAADQVAEAPMAVMAESAELEAAEVQSTAFGEMDAQAFSEKSEDAPLPALAPQPTQERISPKDAANGLPEDQIAMDGGMGMEEPRGAGESGIPPEGEPAAEDEQIMQEDSQIVLQDSEGTLQVTAEESMLYDAPELDAAALSTPEGNVVAAVLPQENAPMVTPSSLHLLEAALLIIALLTALIAWRIRKRAL